MGMWYGVSVVSPQHFNAQCIDNMYMYIQANPSIYLITLILLLAYMLRSTKNCTFHDMTTHLLTDNATRGHLGNLVSLKSASSFKAKSRSPFCPYLCIHYSPQFLVDSRLCLDAICVWWISHSFRSKPYSYLA